MIKTFDYAKEAEDCLEAAEKARSSETKDFLLAMARVWANLAGANEPAADPLQGVSAASGAAGDAADGREHRIT